MDQWFHRGHAEGATDYSTARGVACSCPELVKIGHSHSSRYNWWVNNIYRKNHYTMKSFSFTKINAVTIHTKRHFPIPRNITVLVTWLSWVLFLTVPRNLYLTSLLKQLSILTRILSECEGVRVTHLWQHVVCCYRFLSGLKRTK